LIHEGHSHTAIEMWLICRFSNGSAEIAEIDEDQAVSDRDRGKKD
jgi:hypothetical protein